MQNKSVLIVGAGLSGAVIARRLAEANCKVTVMDKRDHIGGNCFDFTNQYGIRVHKYGPHLFHTSNQEVVDFLSRFTEWVDYKHKVKAMLKDGSYVTLPVNRETKRIVGEENIIDTFIRPYTLKMWGKSIEEIDPSILSRVPVRDDDNEFYFPNDTFQAMPKDGYTKMFERMLDHPNITTLVSATFSKRMEPHFDFIFNSMPIDTYFDNCYGELPYRSIKFHTVDLPFPKVLPVATVNFTHDGAHTRVTEWKNIPVHGENGSMTTLTYEEPCYYRDNNFERYYPVKDADGKNRETYKKYESLVDASKMEFIGRCGQYAYLDMHQAASSALAISKRYIESLS